MKSKNEKCERPVENLSIISIEPLSTCLSVSFLKQSFRKIEVLVDNFFAMRMFATVFLEISPCSRYYVYFDYYIILVKLCLKKMKVKKILEQNIFGVTRND